MPRKLLYQWGPYVLLGLFAAIYGLVSFVNHELFRTYALDLGLYTNAAWKYAHFSLPDRSMFRWDHDLLLADHFDLHLVLWSPLTYLFGQWTLLVVQVIAIPIGALGMYRFCRQLTGDEFLSITTMMGTLCFFGVLTALAFDFHSNVVASMALPWYFLFLLDGRKRLSWLALLFILMGKENMGLWLGTVALAAMALPYLGHVSRRLLLFQSITAFAWSAIVIGWVMPALDNTGNYHLANEYPVLGGTLGEMLRTLVTRPLHVFSAMIMDTKSSDGPDIGIKIEFYFVLLFSGGWALFRKWAFLVMALPLLAQKMLYADPSKWGLFAQYSIEFAVLLPLAVLSVLMEQRSTLVRRILALVSLALVIGGTAYTLHLPRQHKDPEHGEHDRLRFFQARHYKPYRDQKVLHAALDMIPSNASVSALTPLVPHLIGRHELHQFPIMWDDDYVILVPNVFPWPLTDAEYAERIHQFRVDPEWTTLMDHRDVVLFKRNRSEP